MARNTIVGKNKRPKSNKATGRSYEYDKEYQKSKARLEMLLPKLLEQLKQQSITQTIEIEPDAIEVIENVD